MFCCYNGGFRSHGHAYDRGMMAESNNHLLKATQHLCSSVTSVYSQCVHLFNLDYESWQCRYEVPSYGQRWSLRSIIS